MKMIQKLFRAGTMWFQPELPCRATQLDLPFRSLPTNRKPTRHV